MSRVVEKCAPADGLKGMLSDTLNDVAEASVQHAFRPERGLLCGEACGEFQTIRSLQQFSRFNLGT